MVIVMTNDSVSVYKISEEEFERIIALPNHDSELSKNKIYEVPKGGYSLAKMQQQLGDDLFQVKSYYYDNGMSLIKKNISSLEDIQYYEDENHLLWPSKDYSSNSSHVVSVSMKQAELIALDYELNACDHIANLLPPHLVEEFKKLYNQDAYHQKKAQYYPHLSDSLLDYFYDVESFSKLIVKNNNTPLTYKQLEGCVFLTVTPAGINMAGETTYFIEEYIITKQDTEEIGKLYRKYLKDDAVKVAYLSEEDKYMYLDRSVREYRKSLIGDLSRVGSKSRDILNGKTYTWSAYKAEFFNKYGYIVGEFDSSWVSFDIVKIDARTIHNGYIVPMITETYQRESSVVHHVDIDDTLDDSQSVMSATDLIRPDDEYGDPDSEFELPDLEDSFSSEFLVPFDDDEETSDKKKDNPPVMQATTPLVTSPFSTPGFVKKPEDTKTKPAEGSAVIRAIYSEEPTSPFSTPRFVKKPEDTKTKPAEDSAVIKAIYSEEPTSPFSTPGFVKKPEDTKTKPAEDSAVIKAIYSEEPTSPFSTSGFVKKTEDTKTSTSDGAAVIRTSDQKVVEGNPFLQTPIMKPTTDDSYEDKYRALVKDYEAIGGFISKVDTMLARIGQQISINRSLVDEDIISEHLRLKAELDKIISSYQFDKSRLAGEIRFMKTAKEEDDLKVSTQYIVAMSNISLLDNDLNRLISKIEDLGQRVDNLINGNKPSKKHK